MTTLRRLFSKFSAFIIYHAFIYFSRHVSFADFQIIWNEAYQAHVEAEWKKMKASGLSSMNINPRLGRLEEGVAAQLNAQQSRPISPKPDSDAGQEEKPQLSQPMSPSQSKLKYKRKGV